MRDDETGPKVHLGQDHEMVCTEESHAFTRAVVDAACACGELRLTAGDLADMCKAPYGFLVAHGLALPVCPN